MLKTEEDGRMFPTTDSSQTVIDALLRAAREAGVEIQTRAMVESIEWVEEKDENDENVSTTTATTTISSSSSSSSGGSTSATTSRGSYRIHYRRKTEKDPDGGDSTSVPCVLQDVDAVILATGSAPAGYALLRQSGALLSSFDDDEQDGSREAEMMVATVPSLFTLRTSNDLLNDLAGISVPHATISYRPPEVVLAAVVSPHHHDNGEEAAAVAAAHDDDKKNNHVKQKTSATRRRRKGGRRGDDNVITHDRGLSGPAALRLSAFAAFAMAEHQYKGTLWINWLGGTTNDETSVFDNIWSMTTRHPQRTLGHSCPVDESHAIPKRLWWALVEKAAGLDRNKRWADLSKLQAKALTRALVQCPLDLVGKGTFKDEFVTAGGVSLTAIDMKTMQCKYRPGLFVCGELINVDGITGGYNFMNCWGTGYVAGRSARAYVEQQRQQPETTL
jgi:predicted flavoprotein YhiN